MIIGVFGKGGSGKSTIATALVRHLHGAGNTVLAIDADHNMDLSFNLGNVEHPAPIGGNVDAMKAHLGYDEDTYFGDIVLNTDASSLPFSLNPADPITARFTVEIAPGLLLMQTGPQTEQVIHGMHCSHYLATPLKLYLPLLHLGEREWAVVDEKASVDAVTTGIPSGMDVVLIAVEPKTHSIKVAKQIADALTQFEIPYAFVANKIANVKERPLLEEELPHTPIAWLPFTNNEPEDGYFEKIIASVMKQKTGMSRLARSQKKFERNKTFESECTSMR